MSTLVRWPLPVKLESVEGGSEPFPAYEDSTELYSEESWRRTKENSLELLPDGFFSQDFPRNLACIFFRKVNERRDFIGSIGDFEVELEVDDKSALEFPERIRDIRYAQSALSGHGNAPVIENRCLVKDLIPSEILQIAEISATGNSERIVTRRGEVCFFERFLDAFDRVTRIRIPTDRDIERYVIEIHRDSLDLARAIINAIVSGGDVIAVVSVDANLDIFVNGDLVENRIPRKFLYAVSILHLRHQAEFSLEEFSELWGSLIDVRAFNNHVNAVRRQCGLSTFWNSSGGYRRIYGLSWNIQATEEDIRRKLSSL